MTVVPFRAPARRRLHEDVAEQLRDAILDGRFRAGTKLPPERELALEFGVNRTSVREAIKVLEGLGLVTVRQGDGATVRPLVDASLEVLGPMIFHGGRIDLALVGEMAEVMRPLLLEMGRLAIERCRPADLAAIRRFRNVAADARRDREVRFAAIHELFVLLADMTRNRVWQMLARRLRALFRQEPVQAARERLRRDPGRFIPLIDACLAALDAKRTGEAVASLQRLIQLLGDFSDIAEPARQIPPQRSDPMSAFTLETPTQEPGLATAMHVVYQWNYAPQVEELRHLYVKATEAQWVATRDIDWTRPIDLVRFSTTPLGAGIPIEKTSYWRSLPQDTVVELTRRTAAFRLSQFLHGEQGALMVAAQLVNAVPHTDAKFYAATQTMDEARHVEVFARYIEKLDSIGPIAPSLRGILDQTLQTGDWMKKLVGMQIVVEGLALYAFREMRNLTEEPLLKELLTYVARDESRHHAYGVQYIERCVPCLGAVERRELEDFALECARSLIDRNAQGFFTTLLGIWQEVGVDPAAMLASLHEEREEITRDLPRGRRLGPVQGFVIPTLRRCGLLSERVAAHFHDFLRENFGTRVAGENVEEFLQYLPELPADTAKWVLGELQ